MFDLSDLADTPAYENGFKARQQGKPATDNPYSEGSEARSQWDMGWTDLDGYFREREASQ